MLIALDLVGEVLLVAVDENREKQITTIGVMLAIMMRNGVHPSCILIGMRKFIVLKRMKHIFHLKRQVFRREQTEDTFYDVVKVKKVALMECIFVMQIR